MEENEEKKDEKVIDIGGRPPKFSSVEELTEKINEYFNGGMKKRSVVVGHAAAKKVVEIPVPTISGLALFLGFASRQSFYDYEKEEGFSYTIKRARLFIESEYEEQLQFGNVTGAIFALKNLGWKDKSEVVNKNLNSKELSEEEIKELDELLKNEY
jgi:hypothetical protein